MARRKKGSKYRKNTTPSTVTSMMNIPTTALQPTTLDPLVETVKERDLDDRVDDKLVSNTHTTRGGDKENASASVNRIGVIDSFDSKPVAADVIFDQSSSTRTTTKEHELVAVPEPSTYNDNKSVPFSVVSFSSPSRTVHMSEQEKLLLAVDTSDLALEEDEHEQEDSAGHPSLSPYTPAESFFLQPELGTSHISAFALASQLHANNNTQSITSTSAATDDFQSAVESQHEYDDAMMMMPTHPTSLFHHNSLFGKDVLVISQEPIPEEALDYKEAATTTTATMSVRNSYNSTVPKPPTDDHPNVTMQVYEGAKGVWTWGKGVAVVNTFLGLAEGVAGKVLSVAGTSLEDLDTTITPKLEGLDADFVNPAVEALVKALMDGIAKGDETLRPIVLTLIGPVLKMIEAKKEENPEVVTTKD